MSEADRLATTPPRPQPIPFPRLRAVPAEALLPPAPPAAPAPDADLCAIAAAFAGLHAAVSREIDAAAAAQRARGADRQADAAADRRLHAALRPLHAGQRRLVGRMAAIAAGTPAGIALKARVLCAWAPEWAPQHLDRQEADATDRLLASLLDDLLALAGAGRS
jgi:hypothetical protein